MLEGLKAEDVYIKTKDYPNLSHRAAVGDAFHIMDQVINNKTRFRTILVLDDADRLIGYISLSDLIRAVGPEYLKQKRPRFMKNQPLDGFDQNLTSLSLLWQEGFTLNLKDVLPKPISEIMTPMEYQVALDDSIAKCLYLMFYRDLLILPVVNNGQMIGVIRMIDLFDRISDNVINAWKPARE